MLNKLAHTSFLVSDIEHSLRFYHDVLKLEIDPSRPDLGYPGVWLNIGEQQVHLLELPNPDPIESRPAHGGRDRHIAFNVDDLSGVRGALDDAEIEYTVSQSGRNALFCRDPDGNALEFIEVVV